MSAISNFTACRRFQNGAALTKDSPGVGLITNKFLTTKISTPFPKVSLVHSKRMFKGSNIRMTMVDERLSSGKVVVPSEVLAYELVQGAKVKWSYIMEGSLPEPLTAVLLHGILGSRKNWGSFARRLAQEFPKWQFLLVDLRCHGDSASLKKRGTHTVASAALDVLKLAIDLCNLGERPRYAHHVIISTSASTSPFLFDKLGQLRLTPRVVVGHSFGGKVALSMVEQVPKPLARPVRVWVLDATPGEVRAGADGDDHPAELISFLSKLPKELSPSLVINVSPVQKEFARTTLGLRKVSSKRDIVEALIQEGFSRDVAQWVVTNLRQTNTAGSSPSPLSWVFDLKGIAEMYQSYEETNLWKIVEDVPRGVHVNFLKAERSLHRWALEDIRRIHVAEEQAVEEGGGVEMHVLEDAGHWVHADNPDGLFKILSFSFQGF
ncbi:hypothetical protein MTR67_028270 [Solanum verrucosum]|uniref:AB hydrolase-1 domain-containing protein n=1 Tax=Solanum verrucosum TaxID=315347 RepID=A0AAF0TZW8_SOLVR|nr:hypothetical protein MTR67_028270 [Solanum verrucosum]